MAARTETTPQPGPGPLVPTQSLYGDESGTVVDSIHIEHLRDRSERFDWSIEAHTHGGLHQLVLLSDGAVDVTLDESSAALAAPGVIGIPAGVVHSFEYDPSSAGFVLGIADRQLEGASTGDWIRSHLFGRPLTLPVEPELGDRLLRLCAEIIIEQESLEPHAKANVEWLTRTLLVLLARESDRLARAGPGHRSLDLFAEFRRAVEAHFAERWLVADYAAHLHVSESSLNRVCRAVAGRTAFEVVQDRIEIEARRRLTYTTVPIHRLAAELGFADASYFSRFFRRRTGASPSMFRSAVEAVR